MAFERWIVSDGKRLRCGYTTGTCAALAARAACRYLLTGVLPQAVSVETPSGETVEAPVLPLPGGAFGVVKDAGDDCDATDGALICARAEPRPAGVAVEGGEGVGRVTQPGLDQPVGAAAINRVPREMIARAAEDELRRAGAAGGLLVTIFVPEGARLAEKTFNARLGITGGISILGTSGLVRPMSLQALCDTVGVELRAAAAKGAREAVLYPGNYGAEFLAGMGLRGGPARVEISNFFGPALDFAAEAGYRRLLIVSHLGKLVKLAGGIMNTHSSFADCRAELFTAHAALAGGSPALLRSLMASGSSDACLALLDEAGLREPVLKSLLERIQFHLDGRAHGAFEVGAVTFSRAFGYLGATDTGEKIWNDWRETT